MRFKLLLFCGLLWTSNLLFAQSDIVSLYGKVMKADGFGILSQAVVKVKNVGQIGSSDENGFFSVVVRSKDTLVIEHIGYTPIITSIDRIMMRDTSTVVHHVFMLVPTSYTLKEVKIFSYTREELVQAFLKTPIDSTFNRNALNLEKILLSGYKNEHQKIDMVDYMMQHPNEFRNFTISDFRGVVNTFGPKMSYPISFARKPKPYVKRF